jgi:hypothetical protein
MATISESPESASLKVPMKYLEDVRSGMIAEIVSDSSMLRANHETVLEGTFCGSAEDRTSAAKALHSSMSLLDQVIEAAGDTNHRRGARATSPMRWSAWCTSSPSASIT